MIRGTIVVGSLRIPSFAKLPSLWQKPFCMSTTMSAGVESNWNIVDNDSSLSTVTRSVVGRYASKTGFVATILFLEEFSLQVLLIAPGEVLRVNLDRAAESRCATASLPADWAHSVKAMHTMHCGISPRSNRSGLILRTNAETICSYSIFSSGAEGGQMRSNVAYVCMWLS